MNYLKYIKKSLISIFIGHIVWVSLSTYMVINKGTIGIDNIPVFEVVLFIAGLMSSRIATMNIFSFKTAAYLLVLSEALLLIVTYRISTGSRTGRRNSPVCRVNA